MKGVAFVAAGAALWGTDALFRRGLALELPTVEVVFWEHLLLAVIALALVLPRRANLRALARRDWLALGLIGGGSSVAATVLFTEAFKHGDPTTPLLLQKLQPVFAAGAAYLLLRERLRPRYFLFLAAALGASYLVAFSDPGDVTVERLLPAALGAGAALLWALGTVLGRHAGVKVPPAQLAGLRFLLGLPVAFVLFAALGEGVRAGAGDVPAIVALSLIPGLFALLLYYRGLKDTPAATATLAELSFPATALIVNALAFDTVPSGTQLLGTALLASTVVALTLGEHRGWTGVWIDRPRRARWA
ncbi:DMT family transporter [Solirubrobacter sp. CPCC 204708]|uniref:DMT family transporter n=1 Tax=Solirubrobacter deserti TaxID=2282478 RepID=A0ABT4RFF5_9ACTN|nr:DMT family transporter [Solirubrobacter deserti]MBE2319475.1 DMT family transporter [Solirubrobacter deserti]MDA0137238.1 DMT family transporter [Solirubrobacter deserti]